MKANVGIVDRAVRILIGIALIAAAATGTVGAWGYIGILPLFTICDRWDVGGISTAWLDELGTAAVVIYDGYPGGAGIAELGYEAAPLQLGATLEVLQGCRCESGCPSCVQSPKCGNLNEPLDKHGASAFLEAALAPAPARLKRSA